MPCRGSRRPRSQNRRSTARGLCPGQTAKRRWSALQAIPVADWAGCGPDRRRGRAYRFHRRKAQRASVMGFDHATQPEAAPMRLSVAGQVVVPGCGHIWRGYTSRSLIRWWSAAEKAREMAVGFRTWDSTRSSGENRRSAPEGHRRRRMALETPRDNAITVFLPLSEEDGQNTLIGAVAAHLLSNTGLTHPAPGIRRTPPAPQSATQDRWHPETPAVCAPILPPRRASRLRADHQRPPSADS